MTSDTPEAVESLAEKCPLWCAFEGPHRHPLPTTISASPRSRPTFDCLLNDPTQQLDKDGVVLAAVLGDPLTTAQREYLGQYIAGNDAWHAVETVVRQVAAGYVSPEEQARDRAQQRAEAWDEGYRMCEVDFGESGDDGDVYTPNPYRATRTATPKGGQ